MLSCTHARALATSQTLTKLDLRDNILYQLGEHAGPFTQAIASIPRLAYLRIEPDLISQDTWFELCAQLYDKVRSHQSVAWVFSKILSQCFSPFAAMIFQITEITKGFSEGIDFYFTLHTRGGTGTRI